MESENYAMKISKLFSVLECKDGLVRLNITIHNSNIRGAKMENSGQNFPSRDFMSMNFYNLVGLMCHGIFYTGAISHLNQQLVSKGVVSLYIPIIGRVITIWYKVSFMLRVSFGGLISSTKVFQDSSLHIETHIDVVVKFPEAYISVSFELCLDEEFIECW